MSLEKLKEGKTQFFIFSEDLNSNVPSKSMNVFYNEKMEINRDLTSLAVQSYSDLYEKRELTFIDSMAGSGVGPIRVIMECDNIKYLYINDINPSATRLIKKNLKLNEFLDKDIHIHVSQKDANLLFNELAQGILSTNFDNKRRADVISIDPFGTPNLYINNSLKAVTPNKGLLCITATDTPVLFGVRPKACLRKYMAKPLHNDFCKETGTRILIYLVSRLANINNLGVIPLLSFYSNHFIRLFLLTFNSKKKIFHSMKHYGYLIYCTNCGHRFPTDLNIVDKTKQCPLCGEEQLDFAGPLWIGPLHNSQFLEELLIHAESTEFIGKNKKKLTLLLTFCLNEFHMPPSYFNVHSLCHQIANSSIPTMDVLLSTIRDEGHKASRTHFSPISIKTSTDVLTLKNIIKQLDTEGK